MEQLAAEANDMSRLDTALPADVALEFKQVLNRVYRSLKASADESVDALTVTSAAKVEAAQAHARALAVKLDESDAEITRLTASVRDLKRLLEAGRVERDELYLRVARAEAELKAFTSLAAAGPAVTPQATRAKPGPKPSAAKPAGARSGRKRAEGVDS